MNRPALIAASILLFGCGTPFHLLVHNDLAADTEITVRYQEHYEGKPDAREDTVFVPKGRAEEAVLWWGKPNEDWIEFAWQDVKGAHKVRILGRDFARDTYHAYISPRGVRFAPRDWMDDVHREMTSYMAPMYWCCILTVVGPLVFIAVRKLRESRST